MTRPLSLCVFVFAIFCTFFMWSHYNKRTANIDLLASEVYKIESTMDVEIEREIESTTDVEIEREIESTTDIKVESSMNVELDIRKKDPRMKYVLLWTLPDHDPLMYLLPDQETFINRKCKVKNCSILRDKNYFQNITNFDVILFNGPEVVHSAQPKLPEKRDPSQKYVFASIESSDYYPMCDRKFDGYFNVSWTYKLNSDIFYGYVIIRNNVGEIIGPQKEMHWLTIDEMKPINNTIKEKLSSKKKLAAWLVSNCNAPSGRDQFVKKVKNELAKLGTQWKVDIYGNCGTIKCPRKSMQHCLQIFEEDYYFYFSFENSFAEDYVTEKLLHPLQHYAVPVVFGAANYTRFMPEGIYLDAKKLGPKKLAERMVEIVSDKDLYYSFFKWINHYSFHYLEEVPETDFFCKFCEAINDESLMNRTTVIQNFKDWWNPPKIRTRLCPVSRLAMKTNRHAQ